MIEEYSGGTVQTAYVYAGSTLLTTEISSGTNYLTADHLGSPRIVTDASGNVTSRKDYTAFGEETFTAQRTAGLGYNPRTIRQDYTGYQKDNESGLEYAQARYYNPLHGRFTSVDPLTASATIRDPQSFNRYSYSLNSPYKFTDPLGLISSHTGACGTGCPNGEGSLIGIGGVDHQDVSDNFLQLPPQQQAKPAELPPDCGNDNPFDPQSKNASAADKQTDESLTKTFTDTGIVRGATSARNDPPRPGAEKTDSHYELSNGKLHTIHIYGNENATCTAGVYIPKDFSQVKITSKDTVVATNPKTGEVLLIAHVKVGSMKDLRANMKVSRDNGTVYIGQIGGKGGTAGQDGRGVHSHLTLFPSEKSRLAATAFKRDPRNNSEYTSAISAQLSDFRKLVNK